MTKPKRDILFRPFRSDKPLAEHWKNRKSVAEEIKKKIRKERVRQGLTKARAV